MCRCQARREQSSRLAGALCLLPALIAAPMAWPRSARADIDPPSLRPPEITDDIETAIERGLKFLGRYQGHDGSFGASRQAYRIYPTVMSSLVGMVFMASGSTPTRGPYAQNIQRITDYIVENSVHGSGLLVNASAREQRPMYGHAFAMTFLAMVYGQEGDAVRRERLGKVLHRAIGLTRDVQSRYGGWGYEPSFYEDEGTLTVTQTQALRACRDAGLHVPKAVIDRAVRYLELSTNPDGSVRYRTTSHPGNTRPGVTCAALVTLWNAGRHEDALFRRIANYIDRTIAPEWMNRWSSSWYEEHHAEYVLYFLTQAKFVRGGQDWGPFYRAAADKVLAAQNRDGSWTGKDSRQYGEIYTTAIALLVLQMPYSRLPIYQR